MTDSSAPQPSPASHATPGGAGRRRRAAFFVPGHPRPQGSKRAVARGVVLEQSVHLPAWRARVSAFAATVWDGDVLLAGPVRVSAKFRFARPKSHYHKSKKRSGELRDDAPLFPCDKSRHGDLDKLLRGLFDALTGVIVTDDCMIAEVTHADKRFVPLGGPEGVHVEIEEV